MLNHWAIPKSVIDDLVDRQLIRWCSDTFVIKEIKAGTVNHNFFIADEQNQYLFKIFECNSFLPINRRTVFTLQTQLAAKGLAPEPLYLSENQRYYCEEWITNNDTLLEEGKRLEEETRVSEQDDLKQTAKNVLKLLATALHRIHKCQIKAPNLNLSEHLQIYWSHIQAPNTALTKEYFEILQFCKRYEQANKEQWVLCHNDLQFDHVCKQQGIIFDWEYAAYGCPYYDIANCILINQLTAQESQILCTHYANLSQQKVEDVVESVQNVRNLTEFTHKLWHLAVGHASIIE